MPTERLTEKRLRALEKTKPERRVEYRDSTFSQGCGQLVLRHEVSGHLHWSFVYYVPRERGSKRLRRRITIGRYPRVSLAQAQRQAGEWEAAIAEGKDPGSAVHGARSFADLWAEYLERHAKRTKKSWRLDVSLAKRHVLPFRAERGAPAFGALPVEEITRRDVVRLLDAIVDAGHGRTANAAKSLLSGVFAFGADRGWLEQSPMLGMRRPATTHSRGRKLDEAEIVAFWHACRFHDAVRRACALPLILVTAQRPGEVLLVEREEVELEAALWSIPAEKTKSGRPHLVPLSPLAVRLFREAFASPLSKRHPFLRVEPAAHRNPTFQVGDVDPIRQDMAERLGVKPPRWVPHDLRRTAYSGMTALGIPRFPVVEAVCNHAVPGVAGVYDRHDYLAEKTDALMRWGQHLEDLVEGRRRDNVVPISR